jgi:phytanoyl-CoA hydroxylase
LPAAHVAAQYLAGNFTVRDNALNTIAAVAPDNPAYFTIDQEEPIRRYYAEHGYVVVRDLIPLDVCRQARAEFEREVKPFPGFIYRQASANPERHELSPHGLMMNPILNVQSMDPRNFSRFRDAGLAVLTHVRMQHVVRSLLGAPGKLVQSMYFEGNPATWAHQDTYYLDAEEIGRMTAAWIAVEDIDEGAGRFFIYPGSHRIDLEKNSGEMNIAFNHARYKQHVLDIIERHGLECRTPALRAGDVLFWNSKTIHGAVPTTKPSSSRSSFTAHFLPETSRFLQWQSRIKPLNVDRVNGIDVHRPKDLASAKNRAVLWVETTFPRTFQTVKRIAVRLLTA